jgi:hypothetical protein
MTGVGRFSMTRSTTCLHVKRLRGARTRDHRLSRRRGLSLSAHINADPHSHASKHAHPQYGRTPAGTQDLTGPIVPSAGTVPRRPPCGETPVPAGVSSGAGSAPRAHCCPAVTASLLTMSTRHDSLTMAPPGVGHRQHLSDLRESEFCAGLTITLYRASAAPSG